MSDIDPSTIQRTPLHAAHLAAGAKMTTFAGWEMPVQYAGVIPEHHAVRRAAGVFDITHMGEFLVSGPSAAGWLDRILTNRVDRLGPWQSQYTLLLNHSGGVIDDLILYRVGGEDKFLLVVNASKVAEDYAWLEAHLPEGDRGVSLQNISGTHFGLALQGPESVNIFHALFGKNAEAPERNTFARLLWQGNVIFVARTGYTGEDGFEFFGDYGCVEAFWNALLAKGKPHGLVPCGLGARDTLRLEMGYPLNGNDLGPERTPLEAGLGAYVDLTDAANPFPGQDILLVQQQTGLPSKLTAFTMVGSTPPPRPHYLILHGGEPIGEIASGTLSPSLGLGIGMAYLPPALAKPGTELQISIRDRLYPAVTCKKPFLRRKPAPDA